MTVFKRKQGDVRDSARVALFGILDITGANPIRGIVRLGSLPAVSLAGGSIINAVAVLDARGRVILPCSVSIPLGPVDGWLVNASPGEWAFEQELTFSDGTVLTWPSDGYDTIEVTEDLA